MASFHKVGLICIREGRLLLCRKWTGSGLWILPGGCIEPGETHLDCLKRELREELGPDVSLSRQEFLWTCMSPGADGGTVQIDLYLGELQGELTASAEIREFTWFGTDGDARSLAPSLREYIVPELQRRKLL